MAEWKEIFWIVGKNWNKIPTIIVMNKNIRFSTTKRDNYLNKPLNVLYFIIIIQNMHFGDGWSRSQTGIHVLDSFGKILNRITKGAVWVVPEKLS